LKPSPEPGLPVPLPRPLSDPLRSYYWFLLITVPILWVAVVFGWFLPNVRKVREAAARTQTKNNLKQFADAIHSFGGGASPPGAQSQDNLKRPTDVWNSEGVLASPAGPQIQDHFKRPADVWNSEGGVASAAGAQSQDHFKMKRTLRDTAESAAVAALLTFLLCTLCLLPRKATNAFYLRSFRNDAATGSLRSAAQAALGSAFRLSGIRDPRRRWPALIRHLLYILFLIRYAQPKFMNLEAGRDWKARLWRSLGEARCALIDVSDLTPFVREEIELAIRCLGFHRVLFVGDDSHTVDAWRQAVLAALESPDVPPERIQVALWTDTAAGRAAFRAQVRAFAGRLPADPPGLNRAAFPETASSSDPGGNAATGEGWRTFLLANLIGAAIAGAQIWAQVRTPDVGLAWFLPTAIYYTLAFLLLLQYLAGSGSAREWLRIGGTFLIGAAIASLPVVADFVALIEGPRENNLKQMGLATYLYDQDHRRPPPLAVRRPDGTPLQSWHMQMLPYLEERENLSIAQISDGTPNTIYFAEREKGPFDLFHLDGPWDGPQNLELLGPIPSFWNRARLTYSSNTLLKTEPAGAPYQALPGPGMQWGAYTPAGWNAQPYPDLSLWLCPQDSNNWPQHSNW
jgi:Protein of unknown function (DUF1559)